MHLSLGPLIPLIKVHPTEISRDMNNNLNDKMFMAEYVIRPKKKSEINLIFNNRKMVN